MIDVSDLTKSYGAIQALRGVSFNIAEGEIVGLLGPNGAGKTTIIKILTGYLQPDEGMVWINDLDVLNHTREVQAQIGYLPETAPLYPELTVQTYLRMMADLRQIPEAEQLACISEAVYATGLQDYLTRSIGTLSKGYRQRLGLAQAILHKPKLLILDEPTVGLDPTQIIEIRNLIRRLAEHSTILFSTHILSEVEVLCDRAIILMNGVVKADARLSDLAATSNAMLVVRESQPDIARVLQGVMGVRGVQSVDPVAGFPAFRILGDPEMTGVDLCPAIYEAARAHGWPVRELWRDVRTLETVFNELARGEEVMN
ncbi:MAG: ATP-binding cassette domain-containing protein [Anaerolineae bacterium]|nr:ATP-binding cassette domain-containing protein [Anaerolineae bacterium]